MPQTTTHDSPITIYSLLRPLLFGLPPETAHELALDALRLGLRSKTVQQRLAKSFLLAPFGEIELFGLKFKNPIGVAAGLDKNGVATNGLAALGFGFVEVGTTTFHPQPGNDRPRLFRLPKDQALINRAGFNNDGTAAAVERLKRNRPETVLGMNIGKSKIVPNAEAVEDYLKSFDLVHQIADYIVVNVSSPNTPNLRELQRADHLEELLSSLQQRNRELAARNDKTLTPLLVKIAPDLSQAEIEAICDVALRLRLAGIVATNTTVSRDNLQTPKRQIEQIGNGGLSGKPLTEKSTEVIKIIYKYTNGKLPIIGVGGVFSGADAFEKIGAGASLVQLYTGFVYRGFAAARDINRELAEIYRQKGIVDFSDAVGSGSK